MTWTITTGSTNGTASIDSSTGVLSYTPTANYNGSDSVVIQVSDGTLSDSLTVNLSISAVNDAPTVTDLNATLALTLPEDSSLSYDFNATDSDGDTMTWTIFTGPTNGTASIDSSSGVLSYTPTANYNGSDSLVVQVSDGTLSDSVMINLSISAVNDAPTVTDLNATLALTLPEDSSLSYDFNATDSDGDTMTWTITTRSTNGTATIDSSTGVLSYTPTSHYNGSDSLVVQVSDGSLSDSVTITLSISAVNDAPTVTDLNATLALTLPEGSSLSYDFNGTDTDGDSLTWTISTGPTNGTASIESSTGVLSYTPTANYNGSDSLGVQVSDGSLSDSVTINLSISSVNDAPVILDLNASLALSLLEDSTLSYDFNATDSDGDTMTWSITTGPTNGTASIDSGTGVLHYTPTANYNGSDNLTVQVSDGASSDNLTISLTVHSENDAPIIFGPSIAITISSAEDTNLTREMNASDPDGDSLVWRVETSPIHGMASVDSSTGFLNYVPNLNFVGLDSLTLEVSDGILFDRQVFNIVVTAVNDAPEISSVFEILDLNTTEDEGLSYDLNASDLDGDSLTWSVLSSPSNGSSSIDSSTGNLLYWPNPNYTGADSLTVKVSDGSLDDNITVNLSISPINDEPVIIESSPSLSFTFFEDQNFTREMNASDVDGDSLTWSISSSPTHGIALVNSSTGYLSYIPNSNFVGLDSLKVELSDGFLTDQQIFNFVMIEKNDAPVFTDSTDTLAFTLSEDQQLSRMINASDAEGDDISWSIRQAPTNGTASIISSTGMLFYLPNLNYFGSDLLTVQVSDGSLSSEITIYLSVLPINDAPVINELNSTLSFTQFEDQNFSREINATDVDADSLTWSLSIPPAHGIASIDSTTGSLIYTPNDNYLGADGLSIRVTDGSLFDELVLQLNVIGVNDAPVITNPESPLTLSTTEDNSLSYDLNATDADGDNLTWSISSVPTNGSASINLTTGIMSYSPNVNFNGSDNLQVQVSDGALTDNIEITVITSSVNDAPVVTVPTSPFSLSVLLNDSIVYDFNASDSDGNTLSWNILSNPSSGSASIDSTLGILNYSPNLNYLGNDSMVVQVSDGSLTNSVTLNLTVIEFNNAPVISETNDFLTFSISEDSLLIYDLNATDADGTTLVWGVSIAPANGIASIDSVSGLLEYTPSPNYSGTESLTVQVSDGLYVDNLQINLNVNAVNDVPIIDEIIKPLTLTVIEDTTIIYDLNATDLDGNTLTWTILSPTTIGTTLLDSRTGMLVYSPQGNFNGSTTLSVQVSDGLSSDSLTVVLNTVPVNDPPNNILLSNSSIAEGLSAGQNIGVFTAEDPDDNQSHTFSLVSGTADNESFSLDLNGSLQTAEIFDFEEKSSYSIRVQTTDQGGMIFEKVFSIAITDSTEISVDSVVLLSEGVTATAGWKQAGWFGYYFSQSYPWIYHSNLGWIYVSESETTGLWLYREPLGWLWTNPSIYPYLYKNESSNWLYLDREHGPIRYYDYSTSNWDIVE
jgi:VCBS repeat-containing protein